MFSCLNGFFIKKFIRHIRKEKKMGEKENKILELMEYDLSPEVIYNLTSGLKAECPDTSIILSSIRKLSAYDTEFLKEIKECEC